MLELLASLATQEPPPQNKAAFILARFIIPQCHSMTQVAHIARARIFVIVLLTQAKASSEFCGVLGDSKARGL